MGKLSNMMYMIDLLNTGNIYSIKELSEKLGVTENYTNSACYDIESKIIESGVLNCIIHEKKSF